MLNKCLVCLKSDTDVKKLAYLLCSYGFIILQLGIFMLINFFH